MNDRVLEVDDTALVDADDWAFAEPKTAPLSVSDELQRQVDEFLASGGRIKEYEPGETAMPCYQAMWSFPVGKAAAPNIELRDGGIDRRKKAQSAAQKRGTSAVRGTKYTDAELVCIIGTMLGVARNKKEMRDALGCSDNLLQRLLYSHFQNDERADPYRKVDRIDREVERVKLVRQCIAEGHTGITHIAQLLGVRRTVVVDLDRKYGLKVPKEEPGIKGVTKCSNPLCHAKVSRNAKYCQQCGAITAKGTAEQQ